MSSKYDIDRIRELTIFIEKYKKERVPPYFVVEAWYERNRLLYYVNQYQPRLSAIDKLVEAATIAANAALPASKPVKRQ